MTIEELDEAFGNIGPTETYTWVDERGETHTEEEEGCEGWNELEEYLYGDDPKEIEGIGTVRLVEQVGGEGQGDHQHLVIGVIFPGETVERLFKKDGYYSSYADSFYDEALYEVAQVQETVFVYKKLGNQA